MPEYLAPGVYVEETSFRSKSLEGVSTSTAGFVGPARFGPIDGEPVFVTSFAEFTRIFGGLEELDFSDAGSRPNFLAHSVRAFFEEGGKRLYMARIFNGASGQATESTTGSPPSITFTSRYPGEGGNIRITFTPELSENLFVDPDTSQPEIKRIQEYDCVAIVSGSPDNVELYDVVLENDILKLRDDSNTIIDITATIEKAYLLTVNVTVERPIEDPQKPKQKYSEPEDLGSFAVNPSHSNSLSAYFTKEPKSRRIALSVPFYLSADSAIPTGIGVAEEIFGNDFVSLDSNGTPTASPEVFRLTGGTDGNLPLATQYAGKTTNKIKSGLAAFEDVEDISIIAGPGYSYLNGSTATTNAEAIQAQIINHCHKMRYRVAVLDAPNNQELFEIRQYRSKIDSTHAALYYPWIKIQDPLTGNEIDLPPSGFVAGIYARNDVEHGVHKAPANEVVRTAIGFELLLNKAQQDVLNPDGINCFRFFPGRGYRLWGARTISSDPEWKYINVRRYFAYLERTLDKGTQWAVFENNGPALWSNVQRTISDFLFNEWKSGRLLGEKVEHAYFVRCDRSTMTQNDLDNGRLVCLIGVSVLKPAEFVIFRIGQWTADSKR